MRKTKDLTPKMVEVFLKSVDELENVDEVLIEFKQFERLCIKGLYDRMYKKFPYNANSKMAVSTDASPAKIRYIVNN